MGLQGPRLIATRDPPRPSPFTSLASVPNAPIVSRLLWVLDIHTTPTPPLFRALPGGFFGATGGRKGTVP